MFRLWRDRNSDTSMALNISEGLRSLSLSALLTGRGSSGGGGGGVREKSRVATAGWAHQEAGGSALEGVGKNSPFSGWLPAPSQSPGTHTDTDRPPLV